MPIVVDTSIALKWIRIEVYTTQAEALRDDHLRRRDTIYAPSLLVSEAASGLHRFARDGSLTQTEAIAGLDEMLAILRIRPVSRTIAKRAMAIANQTNVKHAYDVQFLALAERLNCDLWTADEEFQKAMNRNGFLQVRLVSAYPLPTT